MAIKINAPFELGAAVPVDIRLTLSKAEMLTVNDNVWPSKYLTVCSDDGAIYLYDKTNEMDVETGKFRILSTDLSSCLEKVSEMPEASATTVGEFVIYTGTTTPEYITGHIYRGITDGQDPAAYSWVDISPDNFQFATMPTASELQGKVVQYVGETTVVEPIYVKGHFYQSVSDGQEPATWSWSELDTEADDYDHIENRPLILRREEELYNDTITLDLGDTTTVTGSFVLKAGKTYTVDIDGIEKSYIATLDGTDVKLITEDGIEISTAENAVDSSIVLTNSEFSTNPAVVITKAQEVEINPNYQDFFTTIGAESKLSENVTANVEVGGVAKGQTLAKDTVFTDVIKALLTKYFAPTITMSTNKTLLNELGTTIAHPISITATSVKQSDDIIKTAISYNDSEVASGTAATGEEVVYTHETDITENTVFSGSVSDGKTTVPATLKFEFINPFFYGNSDVASTEIADFAGLTKLLEKKANKTLPFTAINKYLVFAYDKAYGALTSIKDENNFENLASFDRVELSVNDQSGTPHDYYVYVSHDAITCSAFSYVFKF